MNAPSTGEVGEKRQARKNLKRFLARLLLLVLALAVLAVAALLLFRAYGQSRIAEQTEITSPDGISSLEKVHLGGVEQWILVRGHNRANPVLLVLHGGPGMPQMPLAHLNAALEKHFVVVHWDQRGAGKSYSSALTRESLTTEHFVADAIELTQLLRSRFGAEKIYLVGHSWGTIVGALAVSRRPELFHAYVGVSQVGDAVAAQKTDYDAAMGAAVRAGNQRAIAELKTIGAPPWGKPECHMIVCKWLLHFEEPQRPRFTTSRGIREGMMSPYYSLSDFVKLYRGMHFSLDALWDEIHRVNLPQQVPRIEVPVYFLHGRHDHIIPPQLAQDYFDRLDAPRGKQMIWFENSRHLPHVEEPEKFCTILSNVVLKGDKL